MEDGSEDCLKDLITLNDPLDADSGANGLKNFPVIESVTTSDVTNKTTIIGSYQGGISSSTIDVYSSDVCDSSGFGEGLQWRGSTQVFPGGDGNADFTLEVNDIPTTNYVTATASDPTGTSEFSLCRREGATCGAPPDIDLRSITIAYPETFEACETITLGGTEALPLISGVPVTTRAGESIILEDNVQISSNFTAEIDPALAP